MTTISNHPHPKATTQRLVGCFAAMGLVFMLIGVMGLFLGGIVYGLPLLIIMIPFLIGLSMPLFLLTSLHPTIRIEENGLQLKPLVFPASFITWENMIERIEHTLVKPPAPSKVQQQLKRTPHKGEMILAKTTALPIHYRIVGFMAGQGFKPTFAISNRTHVDYEALQSEIQKHLPQRKEAK